MVATCVTHPLDVLKIRMQISPARLSTLYMASALAKYEGCQAFTCGLGAGLLRQATNTAARLSVYDMLYCKYVKENCARPQGYDKLKLGIGAGLCGAFLGVPSELVLVRRIIEGCPPCPPRCAVCCRQQCTYFGTSDALRKIICREGFTGLWRGTALTLLRSVILSTVYVGSCGEIQDFVRRYIMQTCEKKPVNLRVYTAIAMSLIAAALTSPIDVVKTFYQASRSKFVTHSLTIQCLLRNRGYRGLWKGFTPYFLRMTIHTIVFFIVLDSLENM
ncbi:mitochondrial 2-oxoglutarate/malate carrier protein-like isoform X3 [Plodia interpunctella]|nr:mitochondrial 2-oxoglutarate/malate carrier protein-like isoform X3 [Plodia interpunctella]XP_053610921.1 mitochondrial 2-oxoglutarate/malate carrier protein-like isoform X3 [Plodia interpunctella]